MWRFEPARVCPVAMMMMMMMMMMSDHVYYQHATSTEKSLLHKQDDVQSVQCTFIVNN